VLLVWVLLDLHPDIKVTDELNSKLSQTFKVVAATTAPILAATTAPTLATTMGPTLALAQTLALPAMEVALVPLL
jgi:hypothetical protein